MHICHVSANVDAQMKRSIGVAMRRCASSFFFLAISLADRCGPHSESNAADTT